jgi:hypothetical protein
MNEAPKYDAFGNKYESTMLTNYAKVMDELRWHIIKQQMGGVQLDTNTYVKSPSSFWREYVKELSFKS